MYAKVDEQAEGRKQAGIAKRRATTQRRKAETYDDDGSIIMTHNNAITNLADAAL